MGEISRGSSAHAQTLSATMPNAKPDRPDTNAPAAVPLSTATMKPRVTRGSIERQRGRELDLLEREARADARDARDACQVLEQEALVGAEVGHPDAQQIV